MGRYHASDLVRVPGLLSLARVPLAAAFPFAVNRPFVSLAVLVAAGVSDVLDGWYARRFKQVTAMGSVVDPITDKLFVTTVAITLVLTGHLSVFAVVLLSAREIGEAPLVLWVALSHDARKARIEQTTANAAGKLATGLQFIAVAMALFRAPYVEVSVYVTAVAGALAAVTYWRRALQGKPKRTPSKPDA